MGKKYKIYIGQNEEEFLKVVNALIETGLFVFSYMRCKNLEEIRKYYGSGTESRHLRNLLDYVDWMITGYHEECSRQIAGVDSGWNALHHHEQITLENFLKEIEKENAARRLQTKV